MSIVTNLPVGGTFNVSMAYGEKGNYWACGWHTGIDFTGNTDIWGCCNGTVTETGFQKAGYGNYIKIKDNDRPGVEYIYGHLSAIKVRQGQNIDRNSIIGVMGATGNATGVHLHFEMRINGSPADPSGYLGIPNKRGTYNSANYQVKSSETITATNGYSFTVNAVVDGLGAGDWLNVYEKPDDNTQIAGYRVDPGEKVELGTVQGTFAFVKYLNGDKTAVRCGWVHSKFLKRI